MRDGQGNPLSAEEIAKVKAIESAKTESSVNIISVDPKAGQKPAADSHDGKDEASEQQHARRLEVETQSRKF